jgi:hypothetical protein
MSPIQPETKQRQIQTKNNKEEPEGNKDLLGSQLHAND